MEQNILKKAELKSTKKRQMLLFLLQKQARPMTAEELHEQANNILPMNVSTVYRTLNTLTDKGILVRSVRQDGKAYYALAKKDHYHRLVCDLCGKVIPIDTCPLSELEESLENKTGFRITGHSLEFTGLCPECTKKTNL
ncbi:Fur family transcriptional regulator [Anaerotignum sp.]|nr:Fur family transcriptional regulator [Anaerotignum sp.]MBQ7758974.1 transcriptional repressor [Anaerotignum sp.]